MSILKEDSILRLTLSPIKQYFRLAKFKYNWRKANSHNKTQAVNIFPMEKVKVGEGTYGNLEVYAFGGTVEGLDIGSYCSIAGEVVFILGGEHRMDTVSTYPFARHVFEKQDSGDKSTKGKVIIGDDVWIGHRVVILSGVNVGQGAVIGAGSVVARDVPPYAVYVGNEVKKFRFSEDIIQELLKIDYNSLDQQSMEKFKGFCEEKVTMENVQYIVKALRKEV